ncbi:MAG: septal ring lytic transglycosylase RlpA family protein [Alphaproteobacteria bacterium]|nr:septal ring lytic transglycosylase RlpA family protein [Alphaproteobacteria bacterium]
MMRFLNKKLTVLFLVFFIAGCTTSSDDEILSFSGNRTKNSHIYRISSEGGTYKVGNPYKIFGTWYYPKEDYNYVETGTASWYGRDFHAKSTANGEKYNMNSLTAAHRTLPLPSIVKVTNLENGRSVILRVNDRGPYAKNRIIDISKKGAEILGYQNQGTARVRVEIMAKESQKLKAAMLQKQGISQTASSSVGKSYNNVVKTQKSSYKSGMKFVQAGSFSNYDTANDLKNRLSKYGKTGIYTTKVDGTKFYRVRIGPYKSESEANYVLDEVMDYGIYNAKIVTE